MKDITLVLLIGVGCVAGCREIEVPPEQNRVDTDAELFALVTQT